MANHTLSWWHSITPLKLFKDIVLLHGVVVGVHCTSADPSLVLMLIDIGELQVEGLFTLSLNISLLSPG
jgi:hypothetical protein